MSKHTDEYGEFEEHDEYVDNVALIDEAPDPEALEAMREFVECTAALIVLTEAEKVFEHFHKVDKDWREVWCGNVYSPLNQVELRYLHRRNAVAKRFWKILNTAYTIQRSEDLRTGNAPPDDEEKEMLNYA